ncbi:hypothetical protein [Microbacterium sp.]|uniref:hypothetical protein n=1 Tax=Microbacterium sp. TaxID=51671 RepID=UPI003F9722AC
MLAAVAASIGLIWLVKPGAELQHEVALMLSAGVAPAATAVSLVALLRSAGVLGDMRSLLTVLVAVLAGACGGLAAVSWSRGFDNADAGLPQTGLAAAFLPLAASGLLLSAIGLGLVLSAILSRSRLPIAARIIISAACGVVAAPILGLMTFMSPLVSGLIALVGLIIAALSRRAPSTPAAPPTARWQPGRPRPLAVRVAGLAALLAGSLGVAWAFTGEAWSPLGGDSTTAMRHGIIILSISTIPALIGVGLVASSRSRTGQRDIWIPVCAASVGFCLLALDYVISAGSGDLGPIWVAAVASIGIALGWAVAAPTPVALMLRVAIGAATAATYTVLIGITLTPMLTFVTPLLGLVLVATPRRRAGAPTPAVA